MILIISNDEFKCKYDIDNDVWTINGKRYKWGPMSNRMSFTSRYWFNDLFYDDMYIVDHTKKHFMTRNDFVPRNFITLLKIGETSKKKLNDYIDEYDLDAGQFYELNESDMVDAGIPYRDRKYLSPIFKKMDKKM